MWNILVGLWLTDIYDSCLDDDDDDDDDHCDDD